jgi:WD40 repeat protein
MTRDSTPITSLAFAPNGQTVVSASKDSALRFWNALTGTKLHVLESGEDSLSCVTFSPNGEIIAMGSLNGTIQLWSVTNSTRQYTLKGHIGPIYSLSFSPDSRSLISCGRHGSARIWHVKTGLEERSLIDAVDPVAYSPDGNSIAMGLRTGSVRICDANTSVVAPPIPEDHQAVIKTVVFSPDGHLIASGSFDQTVRIWDATTGTERHIMEVGDPVCSISFSPNGRMVACGQENGTVQAWDVVSGLRQSSMMGQHACVVSFVDFSSDGNSIVSYSSEDGTAQVSDVATGAEQHVLTHPIDKNRFATGRCVAFSANSKEVILRGTYGRDMVIGLWDLTTTQPEYTELTPPRERTRTTDELHISELEYHFRGPESAWILCYIGQEKLTYVCWLPPKRRGILEYSGTKVCIGAKDGTITILDFSPVDILQQIV